MGESREEHTGRAPGPPPHPDDRHRYRKRKTGSGYSEDMILLATSMAAQLARGKTECELETLINILDILGDVLVGILAQRRICERQGIEILQDGDFIV